MLTFKFKKEKLLDGTTSYRPVIPVKFINGDKFVRSLALLDSGCDVTVLPWDYAVILKLQLSKDRQKLFGFREESQVYESAVDIEIGASRLVSKCHIPVLVLPEEESKEPHVEAVIGVRGFFDIFDIRFKLASNKIELKQTDNLRRRVYYR